MKTVIYFILIFFCLLVSCYKPYLVNIATESEILVVNGLLTNEKSSYHVRLTWATDFYSDNKELPVTDAIVYVTDNLGKSYRFMESDNGHYLSDSLQFIGQIGNTYSLSVITAEGEKYESDYQQLAPPVDHDSIYAEFGDLETLNKISGLKVIKHGANILTDVKNESGLPLRLRFNTNLVTQYVNVVCPPFAMCVYYYCWQTENINPIIDLTGGAYTINSASVLKHDLGFVDGDLYCYSLIYYKAMMISWRVIYMNQYTLDDEAFSYYKKIDELLRSDGKLFDPIASQINGNIKCLTHPEKKVLGFFEVSSVNFSAYKIDFRNLDNGQPSITKVPYILPPKPNGFITDIIPSFWVNK
jgi:hypothetical protein